MGRPAGWRAGPCTRRPAPPARAPIAACQAPRVRLSEAGSLLLAAAGQPEWGAAAAAAASFFFREVLRHLRYDERSKCAEYRQELVRALAASKPNILQTTSCEAP